MAGTPYCVPKAELIEICQEKAVLSAEGRADNGYQDNEMDPLD